MVPNGDHILTGYMELNTSALCPLTVNLSSAFQRISHVLSKKTVVRLCGPRVNLTVRGY